MTRIVGRASIADAAPITSIQLLTQRAELHGRVAAVLSDARTSIDAIQSLPGIVAISAPDLILLDATLDAAISMQTLLGLRRRWPCATLIALDVSSEALASQLLNLGVDDAILVGTSWPHTVARLGAATRRTRTANAFLRRRIGDVVYDRDNRRVWCATAEIHFAPRELAVLDCLWWHAGEVVGRATLHDYVWGGDSSPRRDDTRLKVYINYVRRKLQHSREVVIETLRGVGYRLTHVPESRAAPPLPCSPSPSRTARVPRDRSP